MVIFDEHGDDRFRVGASGMKSLSGYHDDTVRPDSPARSFFVLRLLWIDELIPRQDPRGGCAGWSSVTEFVSQFVSRAST
ncbi:hypothetical protein CH267_00500 [Rhodococcus sp. 06-621-2]|nr:hypothetical protein CH267_00500 [Rhodococcus sp. 06-621-2]